jgi:hypothetical protein
MACVEVIAYNERAVAVRLPIYFGQLAANSLLLRRSRKGNVLTECDRSADATALSLLRIAALCEWF